MNVAEQINLRKGVNKSWKQYCKNLGKVSVADVIPAQLFLDAYVYGYRHGKRSKKLTL